jgi:superfamily II DNA or RNA helicase
MVERTTESFPDLEFHRSGIGRVFETPGGQPVLALFVARSADDDTAFTHCSCKQGRQRRGACKHLATLRQRVDECHAAWGQLRWSDVFDASILWQRLAELLHAALPVPTTDVRLELARLDGMSWQRFVETRHGTLLCQLASGAATERFLERCGLAASAHSGRARLLSELRVHTLTDHEHLLNARGARTQRQGFEEGFWHLFGYHAFREWGASAGRFRTAVDTQNARFVLTFSSDEGPPLLQLAVPANAVESVLGLLARERPAQSDLAIHPIPLKSLFCVDHATELDIEVRPLIVALQADGEQRFFERADIERLTFGRLVYIPELKLLAEIEHPGRERRFAAPRRMTLARSQVPALVQELEAVAAVVDGNLRPLRMHTDFERLEISARATGAAEYWLEGRYVLGEGSVSLAEMLRARLADSTHVSVADGFVDLRATPFAQVVRLARAIGDSDLRDDSVRLSAREVLALASDTNRRVQVEDKGGRDGALERLLGLQPPVSPPAPAALATPLRAYQKLGLDWLFFLYENGLAGLLCDEMGLGKTHQIMALFLALNEQGAAKGPFLVACPTTVLSHWRDKLAAHAPTLAVVLYYGNERTLPDLGGQPTVVLTSYGVLRNDAAHLGEVPFAVAVFDEVQQLKNPETQAHQAAAQVRTPCKIGVTGTPIENDIGDLRALFELWLPGYLEEERAFRERYSTTAAGHQDLRRRIAPFVLRRLKADVLAELPEKIEDARRCPLSADQARLYQEALEARARPLIERLRSADQPIPYMHVFALLTLLKRICDHPGLVSGQAADFESLASGKWDLFLELLEEALDSGQKVVVFSQFLGMLAHMERTLVGRSIGCVKLTGASRNRGQLIERFNRDESCRVFLGSLKAGGTGIDLIAASVVIHYDRWWNAAREDQATDRVHRIGQRRAVQVFKLITEGTLEERIHALIQEKRELLSDVIEADDPHLAKLYSREELIALLTPPKA